MDKRNRLQVSKFKAKIRRLKKKRKAIEQQFPDIDFADGRIRQAFRDWQDTVNKLVYSEVDLKFCFLADRTKHCSICNCNKIDYIFKDKKP